MIAFVALGALVGCHKDPEPIVYPDKLAPLDADNQAPKIPPQGDDAYPEAFTVASGEDEDWYWAHARGNVHEDAATVWTCLQTTDVVVDRREVDAWTSESGVDPTFDASLVIHNTVNDIITVDYDLTWVHELQDGTVAAPERVVVHWDKTDGTNVIDLLSGSIELETPEPEVTTLAFEEHLKAALRDDATIASYLEDLYDSVVACSHGQPLPTYQ